jgi:hypothetical protein
MYIESDYGALQSTRALCALQSTRALCALRSILNFKLRMIDLNRSI